MKAVSEGPYCSQDKDQQHNCGLMSSTVWPLFLSPISSHTHACLSLNSRNTDLLLPVVKHPSTTGPLHMLTPLHGSHLLILEIWRSQHTQSFSQSKLSRTSLSQTPPFLVPIYLSQLEFHTFIWLASLLGYKHHKEWNYVFFCSPLDPQGHHKAWHMVSTEYPSN